MKKNQSAALIYEANADYGNFFFVENFLLDCDRKSYLMSNLKDQI